MKLMTSRKIITDGKSQKLPINQNDLKRPLSLIFIFIYGAGFVITSVIDAAFTIDFTDFLYGFLIIIIIFCIPLILLFLILFIKTARLAGKGK